MKYLVKIDFKVESLHDAAIIFHEIGAEDDNMDDKTAQKRAKELADEQVASLESRFGVRDVEMKVGVWHLVRM